MKPILCLLFKYFSFILIKHVIKKNIFTNIIRVSIKRNEIPTNEVIEIE